MDILSALKKLITVTFAAEFDNGNSGSAKTIDFANGQNQRVTLTANTTLTIATPPGVGTFQLRMIQDGTGGRTVAFSGLNNGRWLGSAAAPPVNMATGGETNLTVIYDGTNCIQQLLQVGVDSAAKLVATVDDSGGPVTAYIHDTSTALGNADSVHTSYRVNGAEIAYIDKGGWFNGGPFMHVVIGIDVLVITEYVVLTNGLGFGFGAELALGYDDGTSTAFLQGNGGGTYTVLIGGETHDFTIAGQHVIGPVVVSGANSGAGATGTSQHGGKLQVRGGNAVGNGNGGDLEIFGGTKAGSGTQGRVLIKDLPVSATGLAAGTLWNDSGTIKIT